MFDLAPSEDEGLSKFLQLHTYLKLSETRLDENIVPKIEIGSEILQKVIKTEQKSEPKTRNSYIDVMRLKEFKISGKIGRPGEKDKLSYSSLSYQMMNGKKRDILIWWE